MFGVEMVESYLNKTFEILFLGVSNLQLCKY